MIYELPKFCIRWSICAVLVHNVISRTCSRNVILKRRISIIALTFWPNPHKGLHTKDRKHKNGHNWILASQASKRIIIKPWENTLNPHIRTNAHLPYKSQCINDSNWPRAIRYQNGSYIQELISKSGITYYFLILDSSSPKLIHLDTWLFTFSLTGEAKT